MPKPSQLAAPTPQPERLVLTLKLTINGDEHEIPGGNIKRFGLDLGGHGVEGDVEFWLVDDQDHGGGKKDELLEGFLESDLIEVELSVKPLHLDIDKDEVDAIELKGLVRSKTLTEVAVQPLQGESVLFRRYGIRFTDCAQLLWRQHYPCQLYTKKSVKDILEEHKGDKITLEYKNEQGGGGGDDDDGGGGGGDDAGGDDDGGDCLTQKHPMLFIGLLPDAGASFYDFVLWWIDSQGWVWAYDHKAHLYRITADKSTAGETVTLLRSDMEQVEVRFPEVPRHKVVVLNGYSEDPQKQDVDQDQAVEGVRHDLLLRTPLSDEFDRCKDLADKRLKVRGRELVLSYRRFPSVSFVPGSLVKLKTKQGFSGDLLPLKDGAWRVLRIQMSGQAVDDRTTMDFDNTDTAYHFSLIAELERKAEVTVKLPPFRAPSYPVHVEGKIATDDGDGGGDDDAGGGDDAGGDEKDEQNYRFYTDEKTSIDTYKVAIPLWDNQKIDLPYNPNLFTGHVYFPVYNKARVLVALDFQQAWLKRLLDWRPGARLPMDGQGDHILLGKSTKSNTSVSHYYDEETPVFKILRTNATDTGMIRIKEGSLLIQVKQEEDESGDGADDSAGSGE